MTIRFIFVSLIFVLMSSSSFAGPAIRPLNNCSVVSTDPNHKEEYKIAVEAVDIPSDDPKWPNVAIIAVVTFGGSLSGGVEVTHQVGIFSIARGSPAVTPGANYYAGLTSGNLFELLVNFQPGHSLELKLGAGRLTYTDEYGKKQILSSDPSEGSVAYHFSCDSQ